mmetsp:Transcript_223/g.268  ORF Transcript_223/g.268 Transcript_223/m.268 type:complete len:102 (+) Transcript_223:173-478(+)|eukprot:CAMPEP_0114350936 /NCGR_PEP_ID=MMETSP0101-20121206/16786_1 /TAXON_ID=38822 ORGANISM="Pteridomonas danica, Strain PT" /NCGR_SAMPLE_ID=MMETSP0101 /ASSEMBLY_ACC=CAM_ASM_000211 /LENGTH=101 /DNA_ID=CAMNT_0001490519 /DNA_START=180 /DNA_END=485 /DNA_ORIENTATION=+
MESKASSKDSDLPRSTMLDSKGNRRKAHSECTASEYDSSTKDDVNGSIRSVRVEASVGSPVSKTRAGGSAEESIEDPEGLPPPTINNNNSVPFPQFSGARK